MQTARYNRKSFGVDAVQVNSDNIYQVSDWCNGNVYVKAVERPRPEDYFKVTDEHLDFAVARGDGNVYVKNCKKNAKPGEYVRVTDENLRAVAAWYDGHVYVKPNKNIETVAYIKVPVRRPNNERQTQAFVGDWVLKSEQGFKVYGPKAFADSFESAGDGVEETSVGLSSETEVSDGVAEISVGFRGGY